MVNETLLVFSINPGRSGSAYLQGVLATADGVVGAHEDPPTMVGDDLFVVEQHPRVDSVASRRRKVDAINAALLSSPVNMATVRAYVDTSNMFIKTFADVVAEEFAAHRVKVVQLRRNVVDVARSFRELGCYTAQNTVSRPWMFDPLAPQSLAARYHRVSSDNPTEMIVGYLVETELLGHRFRAEHPDIAVYEVWLEELQTLGRVEALLTDLGLHATLETKTVVGAPRNTKEQSKASVGAMVENGFADRVFATLAKFADAGAPIGPLL